MAIFKKYIEPPKNNDQLVYNASIKKYFMELEELFISAGFIKSNTVKNMNFDKLRYPELKKATTEYNYLYSPDYIEFDFGDAGQSLLPLRIRIEFGLFKYQPPSNYGYLNFFRTTVGIIDINTNEFTSDGKKSFISTNTTSFTSTGFEISNYDSNISSFIVKNDEITSITLSPDFSESTNASYLNTGNSYPLSECVVYRINENEITLMHRGDSTVSSDDSSWYSTSINRSGVKSTTSFWVYSNISTYLSMGKLITYPVFIVESNNKITQHDKLILCKNSAIPTAGNIKLKIDNMEYDFVGLTASRNYISAGARLMVRVD